MRLAIFWAFRGLWCYHIIPFVLLLYCTCYFFSRSYILTVYNGDNLDVPWMCVLHRQIALGTDYAGMWSSDDNLAKELNDVRLRLEYSTHVVRRDSSCYIIGDPFELIFFSCCKGFLLSARFSSSFLSLVPPFGYMRKATRRNRFFGNTRCCIVCCIV